MDFLSGAATDHLQLSSSILTPLLNADNASEPIGGGNLSGVSKMITVNSTADAVDNSDGVTTLREAINFANADTTEDAIVFDSSVFATAQTISLSLGELNITHNLSIIAPRNSSTGEDLLTISGFNASRVFEIGTAATVTLSGLIIANAKVSDGNGGGINNSGTLTLDHSVIRDNTLALNSTNNAYGGGIYNTGTLELDNSYLSGNSIKQSGYGGGIYNTGRVRVSNTTIRENLLNIEGNGGGIYNTGSFDIINSTISGNLATNRSSGGGGIYNTGNLKISDSTLSGNASGSNSIGGRSDGGGIYNTGNLDISTSTLRDNTNSDGSGGALYNSTSGIVTVSNSTLSNNRGIRSSGGAISNNGTLIVSNSTLISNITQASLNDVFGGGIYNTGTLKVSDSTLNDNSAISGGGGAYGGGIYNSVTGYMIVTNSNFEHNNLSKITYKINSGGGIYNIGNLDISNTTLSGNSAPNGGGIFNDGDITVTNSTLIGNFTIVGKLLGGDSRRIGGNGGGIFNSNRGILTISNSTFSQNLTTDGTNGISSNLPEFILSGGGIFNSGLVKLLFTTVVDNQATNGGGVFSDDVASTTVRNTIIASNLNSTGGNNPDVSGDFISLGYNLIGNTTGSTGFNTTGDIVGTTDNPIDPRLDALLFNDVSTGTYSLLSDSPAIDAGDPSVLATDPTTDQRSQPRVSGMLPDIGAYEFSQA